MAPGYDHLHWYYEPLVRAYVPGPNRFTDTSTMTADTTSGTTADVTYSITAHTRQVAYESIFAPNPPPFYFRLQAKLNGPGLLSWTFDRFTNWKARYERSISLNE